ncbi:hypothetical protein RJ639_013378 [Escallonia herrerae]|uniref:Leucine-rich repeat-containing N-terminal plant-type domain-containing protein n=1 Tax=Escallonia herrerae TaxID=1293975 RepID=A0AA88VHC2_9ASTE|nr:hypothetical protein RJ639_013378 [Escallonia herrerae]
MGREHFQILPLILLALLVSVEAIPTSIEKEMAALVKFKESLNDTYRQLSSWIGEDFCKWKGVGCNNETGHVLMLDLRSIRGLGGQISPSLLDLKYLNSLDLSHNDFQGIPIPSFLGSLEQLIYLDLSRASFAGMVPPHLGNLSNLRHLDLSQSPYDNSKKSWAADLYWLPSLSSLEYLNMDYVNISLATSHWLQAINMLPFLTELSLSGCYLTNLPSSLLPSLNLTSLFVLDLSHNNFNSSMPQWFFNVSTLVDLELSYCSVKGLYPHVANGNFCGFRSLGLAGNDIRAEISEVVRGLAGCTENSLEKLSLSSNRLSGQLPYSIGYFKKLRSISLDGNLITGPIPASVGELSNLESLDLSSNKMNGSIVETLGTLGELNYLDLRQNNWEGFLWQNHLQGLSKLKTFMISSSLPSGKALVFNISHDWLPPFNLTFIGISHCDLGPKFPAWFESQTQLGMIFLTDLAISDTIPHWFWKLSSKVGMFDLFNNQLRGELPTSLPFSSNTWVDLSSNGLEGPLPLWPNVSYLNLANNLFSGSIPASIGHVMQTLLALDLSGNFLTGCIPSSLGKVKPLYYLFLSNNQLTGKIHDEWGSFQDLDTIDVSNNHFSGKIPTAICSLPFLSVLKVASSNLSGELSLSLKNCAKLGLLDLALNRFIGNIPSWIGESLTSLSVLRLRGNLFKGNIPQTLCHLSRLHFLDLAQNDLSGSIPACLGNLSGFSSLASYNQQPLYLYTIPVIGLEVATKGTEVRYTLTLALINIMDFSSNNLTGEIPEEITSLSTLGTLNLSHYQLKGWIPHKVGGLHLLESLDLSCNHLSGQIPATMTSMTSLNHLNLSWNNFSGPIPSANQFLTFNDPSIYEGNPQLCGGPLSTKCTAPNVGDDDRSHANGYTDIDRYEKLGFYSSVASGFLAGFGGVCLSLLMNESWRHAYFRLTDRVQDWLVVVVVGNANRFRRILRRERI